VSACLSTTATGFKERNPKVAGFGLKAKNYPEYKLTAFLFPARITALDARKTFPHERGKTN